MRLFVMGYSDTVWGFLLSAIGCAAMFVEELKSPNGSSSVSSKSSELLEKEKQLAQVEKSLEILHKRQTDAEEGLKFAAENDVSELVQAGIYSPEKASEALNAVEVMRHVAESTPNMIRVTEEMRDRLINEIESLKKI